LTPFRYKDWEKPDLSAVSEEFTRGRGKFVDCGVISKGDKLVSYRINLKDRMRTIEKDLGRLLQKAKIEKTILVSHAPPKNTALDLTAANEHVGSDALRKLIEEKKPCLVLSSHVHEAVKKSGTFKQKLGETICMAPGNDHRNREVAVIEFNLYAPEKAKRLII
jgi:hypothetical protein